MEPVASLVSGGSVAAPAVAGVAPTTAAAAPDEGTMPAKADLPPKYANDPLPTYGDAVVDVPPPLQGYIGTVVLTPTAELQDVLVDGHPVGTPGTFFATMLIAWFFGLVGFLCAIMLSSTHAGRAGARAGVGLQFMHWGFYMRAVLHGGVWTMPHEQSADGSEAGEHEEGSNASGSTATGSDSGYVNPYNNSDDSAYAMLPLWVAYLLIVLGWFLFVHGCAMFYRARRAVRCRQLTVLASSSSS
jgi:hypothetical protein